MTRVRHHYIYRKWKYQLLSNVAPTFCLRRKARRGYLSRVATELARGSFLDIGCGVGIATILYGRIGRGPSVGLDAWGEMIHLARDESRRHRSRATFVRGASERLPFADDSFDTVYLGQILEHLEEVKSSLREASRVLRPGGTLIISVPDQDLVPSEGHVRVFDARSLRSLFTEQGYHSVRFHPFDDRRLVCSGAKSSTPCRLSALS